VDVTGIWQPVLPAETMGAWVYGTVINYVIGVPDSAANRAMLDGLAPGDLISIVGNDGSVNQFSFDRRDTVQVGSREVFAQNTPGVTLLLIGTSNTDLRLMAHGRYVVPEASAASQSSRVELGETAQLDNFLITVNSTRLLSNGSGAPAGFAYFLIDYALENVGQVAVDAGTLNLLLVDQFGNQYALNPLAAQLGNFPLAQGPIPPGQAIGATAGYQIPAGLSGGLSWVVVGSGNAGRIEVNLPFGESANNQESASIALLQGQVSLDGTSLNLQGRATNLSADQPLIIEEKDVSLNSGGTVYLLASTSPGFPWVVGPGQSIEFNVQFQRPFEAEAVFTVLNFPFALNGLR
jgi:hypothetical protein